MITMRKTLYLLLCGGLSVLLASNVYGVEYYVDQSHASANDTNPGSEVLPWKTISHAAQTVVAGDTVWVKAGTYTEILSDSLPLDGLKVKNSGTAGNVITFAAVNGEDVIIDQQGLGSGFQLFSKSYIVIEGFEIKNAVGGGVFIYDGGEYITIRNNHIHHIDGPTGSNVGGITFSAVKNGLIQNNLIHDVYVGGQHYQNAAGIHSYGMENTTIEYNTILNTYNGIYHKKSSGAKGLLVRNNFFHQNEKGIWYSIQGTGSPPHINQEVYNNIFYQNTMGISASVHETSTASTGLFVANNTFIECGIGLRGMSNVQIWNNIFYNSNKHALSTANDSGGGMHPTSITYLDHNAYYPNLKMAFDVYGSDYEAGSLTELQSLASVITLDYATPAGQSKAIDPQFINPTALDFNISSTSNLVGAGKNGENIGASSVVGTTIGTGKILPPGGFVVN